MSNLVKVKDVIERVNTKEDRFNTDRLYYVGGEHFQSEALTVDDRGIIKGSTIGPMFYYGFKANDFLLVSRNPHLRKAGLVNFDGICSEKTFVLHTKNESILLQKFIPFIFQNERFWKYAIANKHGSTNFFVNWSTLADYSFELPSIEQQKAISKLLWALNDTKKAYEDLIQKTDELVKSQFIEMFGDLINSPKYPGIRLGDLGEMITGGTPSSKHDEYYGGDIPFVSTPCLGKNYITETDAQNYLTEIGVKNSATHIIPPYSLMVGNRVGVGKSSINTCEMCTNQDILSFINIDTGKFDLLFLKKVIDQYAPYYDEQKRGATIKGVPSELIKKSMVPDVSLEVQREYTKFVKQSDKSKFELNEAIKDLDAMYKRIIKDNLG
jgi:type I restriction enzyme S subunit